MKRITSLSALILVVLFGACASLQNSRMDEEMRYQGSFLCKAHSEEKAGLKETPAEADVSRIRCAKDQISIQGSDLVFTRTLYQEKTCSAPLGRIEFTTSYQTAKNELKLDPPRCKFIRVNPGWLGEDSGKCMIKDLNLNQPYPLKAYPCRHYVPVECNTASPIIVQALDTLSASDHEPFRHVTLHPAAEANRGADCERYAGE